jgi:hypothetical protein
VPVDCDRALSQAGSGSIVTRFQERRDLTLDIDARARVTGDGRVEITRQQSKARITKLESALFCRWWQEEPART